MIFFHKLLRIIVLLIVTLVGTTGARAFDELQPAVSYPVTVAPHDNQSINHAFPARAPPREHHTEPERIGQTYYPTNNDWFGKVTAVANQSTTSSHLTQFTGHNVIITGAQYASAGGPDVLLGVSNTGEVLAFLHASIVPNSGFVIPPTREIPTWHGSGPRGGVIGLDSESKSNGVLRNFNPNEGVEFVFDPSTSTFLVRAPSSPVKHSILADSIGAPRDQVVGGILTRGPDGKFLTNEASGHFHQNWTPELRTQFTETMRRYGLEFDHRVGM